MKFIDINKRVRLNKSALESWFSLTLTYLSFLVNMSAIGYCILSSNDNPSLAGLLMNYALGLSTDITNFILSAAYFETKIVSLERIYTFMKINP
jgi:ATP-binding cassette subfamily C (CFTR/MRP) protein 2